MIHSGLPDCGISKSIVELPQARSMRHSGENLRKVPGMPSNADAPGTAGFDSDKFFRHKKYGEQVNL
jgi:hypothetical protein